MEILLKPMFLTLTWEKSSLKITYNWHALKKFELDFFDFPKTQMSP
jgi:hypothetical protein